MRTRGLAEFRVEYNVWREHLAEDLHMTEQEVEQLEQSGVVPETAVPILTEAYGLPADYFTEDLDALAIQEPVNIPKKPFAYFYKVSFVYQLLFALIASVLITSLVAVSLEDIASNAVITAVTAVLSCAVEILAGICLSAYILKKTGFRGKIAEFKFLYLYLSGNAVAVLSTLMQNLNVTVKENVSSLPMGAVFGYLAVLWLFVFLNPLAMAYLLDAAARTDAQEQNKRLKILSLVILASVVLSYVVRLIDGSLFLQSALEWISCALSFLLLLAVLYGVLFGVRKNPRFKTLWLTVLPIAAMALPTVFTVIKTLMG